MLEKVSRALQRPIVGRHRRRSRHDDDPVIIERSDPGADTNRAPVRLAIVGTPRSGNTWLRRLIADACGLAEFGENRIENFPWDELPDEFILQMHVTPGRSILERFARRGIRPIAIARHPLDVLISILQFASRESTTAEWLGGQGGDEAAIIGAAPTDEVFLRYAVGARADVLLAPTLVWWEQSDCLRVRYERLIDDPGHAVGEVLREAGWAADTLVDVLPRHTIAAERAVVGARHVWQGRAGMWRRLLPANVACPIAAHHARVLDALGYACEPDPSLTAAVARARWKDLTCGLPCGRA